jgi:transcriptional antiterminator NusG
LSLGDRCRIIDGPFQDFEGVVTAVDEARRKVTLVINMFGRETSVQLDFLQVERL